MMVTLSTLTIRAVSTAVGVALGTIIYRCRFKNQQQLSSFKAKRKSPYNLRGDYSFMTVNVKRRVSFQRELRAARDFPPRSPKQS